MNDDNLKLIEDFGDFLGLDEAEEDDTEAEISLVGDEIFRPFDPSQIRVETKPMVISLLLDRIKMEEINLSPGFQRKGGIWSTKAKSRLIESLLIRIPLPAFYMDGSDENQWLVVDGLQRLTAMKEFVIDGAYRLRGMEFLSDYEGLSFHELPRRLQRRILETQVTVFLIQEHTPPEVKFNIFKRINTGGLPLSTQEIRHALNQGPAADLLARLAEDDDFLVATRNGISDTRMGDRECILRYIAFSSINPQEYRSYELDVFLNEKMAELNRTQEGTLLQITERFRRSMAINYSLWGKDAFRKRRREGRRGPINRALFEIWSVTVDHLNDHEVEILKDYRSKLDELMLEAFEDRAFDAAISYGTGDPRKVGYRFSKAEEIVREVLRDSTTAS